MMDFQVTTSQRATRYIEPGGRALCKTGATSTHYQIQDTSSSGVALSGPKIPPGTQVSLHLRWPQIGSAHATGVVRRHDPRDHKLGVQYVEGDGLSDLLRDLSAIALMRATEPTPLFCGSSTAMQRCMEQLADTGFDFEHARTPLDAFRLLRDPWKPLTTMVCSPDALWLEFASIIRAELPHLRRVLLCDESSGRNLERAVEMGVVQGLLRDPWHPDVLYAQLGLRLGLEPCLCCGARIASAALPFCTGCSARSRRLCELDDLCGGD